jgi:hypothetical protein
MFAKSEEKLTQRRKDAKKIRSPDQFTERSQRRGDSTELAECPELSQTAAEEPVNNWSAFTVSSALFSVQLAVELPPLCGFA